MVDRSKTLNLLYHISGGKAFPEISIEQLRSHWAMACSTSNPLNCQMSRAQCVVVVVVVDPKISLSLGLRRNIIFQEQRLDL